MSGSYRRTAAPTLFADPSMPITVVCPFEFVRMLNWDGEGTGMFPIISGQASSFAVEVMISSLFFDGLRL